MNPLRNEQGPRQLRTVEGPNKTTNRPQSTTRTVPLSMAFQMAWHRAMQSGQQLCATAFASLFPAGPASPINWALPHGLPRRRAV